MNESEIKATIDRYNERLSKYGATEKALGWGDKGRSNLRFKILLSQWNFDNASILDVGCGFGDLYGYMRKCKIKPAHYVGMDINPNLVQVASQRYPEADFVVGNVLQDSSERYDFVLSSGLFNHKLDDSESFVRKSFEYFDNMSIKGFAANFLSNRVEYELENTFHSDPCFILDTAYGFSNNVVLRNDYMPYEFTIFINKASKIDPALTVYEEHANS